MERVRPAEVTVRGVVMIPAKDEEDKGTFEGVGGIVISTQNDAALTTSFPNGKFSLTHLVEDSDSLTVTFNKDGKVVDTIALSVHPYATKMVVRLVVRLPS